jgi:AhpD family alkylhydroperoxidase
MFDMRNLTRLKKLDENAPDTMKAFWAFNEETFKAGAIDVLHKQLMTVAVALTTQCPCSTELYMKSARESGANDTMLTEAAIVAAAMQANATVTHATHLLKG